MGCVLTISAKGEGASEAAIDPKNVHYPAPASRFGGGLSQFTPVSVVIKCSQTCAQTAVGLIAPQLLWPMPAACG